MQAWRSSAYLILLIVAATVACDRRPIDATAALPAIGSQMPMFDLPGVADSTRVSSASLRGAPAFVALWSTHCPFQGPAMAAFDSLRQEFAARGVQFVLLADDAPGAPLDSALRVAPWWDATVRTGAADGGLAGLFDRSRDARGDARVEFVLPSFLAVDADGRVVARAFGAARELFRPVLDSLTSETATPVGGGHLGQPRVIARGGLRPRLAP